MSQIVGPVIVDHCHGYVVLVTFRRTGSTHRAINIAVYGFAFFPAPGTYVLTCPKGSLGYPACRRLPSSSDGAKSSPSGWPGSSRRLEEALTSPRRPLRYRSGVITLCRYSEASGAI